MRPLSLLGAALFAVLAGLGLLAACGVGATEQSQADPTAAPPTAAIAATAAPAATPVDPTTAAPAVAPTEPPAAEPAATSTPTPTPEPTPHPRPDERPYALNWSSCGDAECGTLDVPLDYDNPDGPTVPLAMGRVSARDPNNRIGSLLVNFGGPGGTGADRMSSLAADVPDSIRDHFDLVSWDPRATGDLMPLTCTVPLRESDIYDEEQGVAAAVEFEVERSVDYSTCSDTPGYLDNVGTLTTVHDMDAIRQALGDDELSYLGYSYGTLLGSLYATVYPDHVRAMVLDGPLPVESHGPSGWLLQMEAFDTQLERFDLLCSLASSCDVSSEGLLATFMRLRSELEAAPVTRTSTLRGGAAFTEADLVEAGVTAMYLPPIEIGEAFAQGLDDLDNGDTFLLDLFLDDGFSYNAYNVVMCADGVGFATVEELAVYIEQRFDRSDIFSESPDVVLCNRWPARTQPLPPIHTDGAPPLLVVATTEDPATPYPGAIEFADSLADAVLLTLVGGGHGSVTTNACVDEAVAAYLVTLVLPSDGARCFEARGAVGLTLDGDPDDQPGMRITEVTPDSPADDAGVRAGDQLLMLAGVAAEELGEIPFIAPGEPVTIEVGRDGATLSFDVIALGPDWTGQ